VNWKLISHLSGQNLLISPEMSKKIRLDGPNKYILSRLKREIFILRKLINHLRVEEMNSIFRGLS